MCPPPCGPRRGWYCRPALIASERIAKRDVDAVINSGKYTCTYTGPGICVEMPFAGTPADLRKILHIGTTKVVVAGSRYSEYKHGMKTIVMTGASFKETIIIRTEE